MKSSDYKKTMLRIQRSILAFMILAVLAVALLLSAFIIPLVANSPTIRLAAIIMGAVLLFSNIMGVIASIKEYDKLQADPSFQETMLDFAPQYHPSVSQVSDKYIETVRPAQNIAVLQQDQPAQYDTPKGKNAREIAEFEQYRRQKSQREKLERQRLEQEQQELKRIEQLKAEREKTEQELEFLRQQQRQIAEFKAEQERLEYLKAEQLKLDYMRAEAQRIQTELQQQRQQTPSNEPQLSKAKQKKMAKRQQILSQNNVLSNVTETPKDDAAQKLLEENQLAVQRLEQLKAEQQLYQRQIEEQERITKLRERQTRVEELRAQSQRLERELAQSFSNTNSTQQASGSQTFSNVAASEQIVPPVRQPISQIVPNAVPLSQTAATQGANFNAPTRNMANFDNLAKSGNFVPVQPSVVVSYIPNQNSAYDFVSMGHTQSYEEKFDEIAKMDKMQFVIYVARLMSNKGYAVKLTPVVDNHGIDMVVEKSNAVLAVSCLHSQKVLSKDDVKVAAEGCKYYGTNQAMALTNMFFDIEAVRFAKHRGIALVDRSILMEDFMSPR